MSVTVKLTDGTMMSFGIVRAVMINLQQCFKSTSGLIALDELYKKTNDQTHVFSDEAIVTLEDLGLMEHRDIHEATRIIVLNALEKNNQDLHLVPPGTLSLS